MRPTWFLIVGNQRDVTQGMRSQVRLLRELEIMWSTWFLIGIYRDCLPFYTEIRYHGQTWYLTRAVHCDSKEHHPHQNPCRCLTFHTRIVHHCWQLTSCEELDNHEVSWVKWQGLEPLNSPWWDRVCFVQQSKIRGAAGWYKFLWGRRIWEEAPRCRASALPSVVLHDVLVQPYLEGLLDYPSGCNHLVHRTVLKCLNTCFRVSKEFFTSLHGSLRGRILARRCHNAICCSQLVHHLLRDQPIVVSTSEIPFQFQD